MQFSDFREALVDPFPPPDGVAEESVGRLSGLSAPTDDGGGR
jgi:hypothetical protein